MRDERLTLLAQSAADLPPLSALLQDATLRLPDMAFDRRGRRLVLLLNRYRHEAGGGSRVRAALRIESVLGVERRAWPHDPETVLPLLAIDLADDFLRLSFGGGAGLRARIEVPEIILEDLSAPWPTLLAPVHD